MSKNESVEKSIPDQIFDELFVLLSQKDEFPKTIIEELKQLAQDGKFSQGNAIKAAIKGKEKQ